MLNFEVYFGGKIGLLMLLWLIMYFVEIVVISKFGFNSLLVYSLD